MRLYKRGRIWWCSFYVDGVRRQRSTRCTDRGAAEKVARQFERDGADPVDAAARKASLGDALLMLVRLREEEARAGRKSAATAAFYRSKAGHLIRVFESADDGRRPLPLKKLSAALVDEYIAQRREEGASENTISKELVTLRAALKLARRRGIWSGDPAAIVPAGFAPQYQPRSRRLSRPELAALLAELTPDHAARVAFIVATSASWGPTTTARREDVSDDLSAVFIRGTKRSSRRRVVPIVTDEQRTLLTYALEHAKGEETLFRAWHNPVRDLGNACDRAEIPKCSPNDLRRTCASWLHARGAPPDLIAPVLGHKDSRMVERVYGRLTPSELAVRLREAMGIAAPDCNAYVPATSDSAGSGGRIGSGDAQKAQRFGGKAMGPDGIEPATLGLKIPCSAN